MNKGNIDDSILKEINQWLKDTVEILKKEPLEESE